jgi:CRP/FNR family cyclic AMP-dependent transcriptional regulator
MEGFNWNKLPLSDKEQTERFSATQIGKDLDEPAAEFIAGYMQAYSLQAGDVICQQGDDSSYLCIISRGRVNIIKTDSEGNEKIVGTVGPGHPLGELSLFDTEPRSASAVASTPVEMLVLDQFSFELICENNTRVWSKLIKPLIKSMTKRFRQTSGLLAEYLKY